jgi:transposase
MVDTTDLLILKTIQDKPGTSLEEIKKIILCHSTTTAYNKVKRLEEEGLLNPLPKARQARSRTVSDKGIALLRANKI